MSVGVNPFAVTSDKVPAVKPGVSVTDETTGFRYRYVKFDSGTGNVAAVQGGVAYWKSQPGKMFPDRQGTTAAEVVPTVTSDQSDAIGAGSIHAAAGIFLGAPTNGEYTWILERGIYLCKVAASTAVGDHLIGSTTDLTFGRVDANGTVAPIARVYGHALEAVGGTEGGKAFCAVDFVS